MGDFDWKKLVSSVAPTIATALGGPLAGVAVQTLSTALLGKPDGKESEIAAALTSGGTDALLKLKQADNEFAEKMKSLDIDFEKLAVQDRASARDREIKTGDSWTPRILATVILVGYFYIQWFLLHSVINDDMREIVMRSLGTVDMAVGLVLGYYFGSSAGSARKDDTISAMKK